MTGPNPINQLLAKARLGTPDYTTEELSAGWERLAAASLVSGALVFDDATAPDLWRDSARQPGMWEADCSDTETRDRIDAADDLRHMCTIVISQTDALHTMSAFVRGSTVSDEDPSRILEPDGARVLACVLHLAGREDSARFWWQFAAGADDGLAKFCLFLHHLALGEIHEANLWHDQVPSAGREMWARAVQDGRDQKTAAAANCLQAIARHKPVPRAAQAVVVYVKDAVDFVDDDVDLPLPADGFAQRIEEMTAGV
nr:hypothetical protein OH826_19030 [Streptomyces sp. NBC_00899]